jgi:hypothetical protein
MAFEAGRMTAAERWEPAYPEDGDASFPGLTFFHLLLGHRSTEELKIAYADCILRGRDKESLLNAVFPKQASQVWMVA